MTEKKDNPGIYVRVADCRDRHSKIELAFFGEDMRGGMVKDITDIKNYVEQNNKERKEEKLEKKETFSVRRAFLFSVLGALVVAGINYLVTRL